MQDKFQVIIADPPWTFNDRLTMSDVKRGAASNYSVSPQEHIKSLPVNNLADPTGCVLALWVPSALLADGLDVMRGWGFKQKQTYVWVKSKKEPFKDLLGAIEKSLSEEEDLSKRTIKKIVSHVGDTCKDQLNQVLQFGMGRLFRQTHEIALIGTNDNGIYSKLMNRSQRSVTFATNLKHSMKPDSLHESFEIMFPEAKKLELYARRPRRGWTCLGNQCAPTVGEDMIDSISHLKSQ